MDKQTTDTIIMIEPVAFGFNAGTAVNNYFQQANDQPDAVIQEQALEEFSAMVKLLQGKGIHVIVIKDTREPHTPDSIFPNNPASFLEDGGGVLYPMFAENRRLEREKDFLYQLEGHGIVIKGIVDMTHHEGNQCYLEGTGSMVLDHENKIAYASISERTDKMLFELFCTENGYYPISFHAFQSVDKRRLPVYHTNVMLCVANNYVVVCMESIDFNQERDLLISSFRKTNKEIIEITEKQMHSFAGNMLQVRNMANQLFLVLSKSAYDALDEKQINQLISYNDLIVVPVPIIEKYGGGSVRCMILEVFGNE
jgi:hypothetical protein